MTTPLITVLMTVYNGGPYLRPAMASLLNQTFKDFEFLVIDDCSQDQSVDVIRSFEDARVRLYINETNMGQTRTLNKGLALAKGRYIARLDADDLAFPQWLEKNLDMIEKSPNLAVVSCKAVVIDSQNTIRRILNTPTEYADMLLRSLLQSPINHVGSLYRADVINAIGGYDTNYKIAADYELWSKLLRHKFLLASHLDPLVAIRFHERSISRLEQGRADFQEITKIMTENFNQMTTLSLTSYEIEQLWRLCYTPEVLSREEFLSSLKILKAGYQRVKSEYRISSEEVLTFMNNQIRVLYFKKIFASMRADQMDQVRQYLQSYFQEVGKWDVMGAIWLGTWFAQPLIEKVPHWYEKWNGIRTQTQIRPELTEALQLKT